MTVNKAMRIGAVFAVLAATAVSGTPSKSVVIDGAVQSAHWATVFTNTVPLTWDWSANTTRADLGITGMNASFAMSFTTVTSNYLWQAFASDVPASEDVYALTLTLYTNGTVVAEVLTSRLAVVTGAFGVTAVNAVSNSPAWSKVKNNVVITYDASFAEAATNAVTSQLVIASETGLVQTNTFADVVGYVGWKIVGSSWGYGTFDLSLTFPGTAANALLAELTRPMGGTMFKVR
jgi:hypothetical protein